MIRFIVGLLFLCSASIASADPILLLLLRMARDRAVSVSLEAGVNSMRQNAALPAPTFGFALPTPPISQGSEELQLRTLLDENFLHLTRQQRDEVFAAMQKILQDPQHKQDRSRLVAEFALTAREVRESYRALDALSDSEKKSLAAQAGEEYRLMSAADRRQLLDVLQAGTLPLPRDLRDGMLAEFNAAAPATEIDRRRGPARDVDVPQQALAARLAY